jgi:uroporphyrinogen-III synthase
LAAADRVELSPPDGIEIATSIVYESVALALPGELEAALRENSLVLVHSAVAMRHLAEQCDARGVDRGRLALAVLSPRLAEAAGGGWARVEAAPAPREAALLALVRDMWH